MTAPGFTPIDERAASAAIREAAQTGQSLEIVSSGTKRNVGRPVAAEAVLDMKAISGILDYKPEELVLSARAGTKLAEIEPILAQRGQMLGFEPCDWGALFGGAASEQTLAGIVAADVCGPRRVKYGAVRDHVIGCRFVNGAGEIIAAGGRVIKNVTGFDITKLMCGAFGTLGAFTEITFRVLPRPSRAAAFILRDCTPETGLAALIRAAQLPLEATGLAYFPAEARRHLDDGQESGSRGQAMIRVEGTAAAVAEKLAFLRTEFHGSEIVIAGQPQTEDLFRKIGDGAIFGPDGDLWRLCVPPSAAPNAIAETGAAIWYADWAGGLLWLQMPASVESAQTLRRITAKSGGHATLFRAPAAARSRIDVFEPEPPVRAKLTRELKQAFDPKAVLNPGRMFEYL